MFRKDGPLDRKGEADESGEFRKKTYLKNCDKDWLFTLIYHIGVLIIDQYMDLDQGFIKSLYPPNVPGTHLNNHLWVNFSCM